MHGLTAPIQHVHLSGTLWLIALLPLLGAIANGVLGTRIQARYGKRGVAAVAVGAMCIALLVGLWNFATLMGLPAAERFLLDHRWTMIRIGALDVNFSLAMDPLSGLMTLIITGVGTLIHVYATSYMESEPSYWRFFCYLNLFVFAMLLLVLGDNFFVMFFGWEGVGLCSYLLIGFWHKDYNKASAGMKAFVVNRVGDWGFVVGLMLLFWTLGGSWGLPNGMEPEYLRRNPVPAGVLPADLEVDDRNAAVGPTLWPVAVTEPISGEHGEHGDPAHGATPAGGPPHGPGAPAGHTQIAPSDEARHPDWLAQAHPPPPVPHGAPQMPQSPHGMSQPPHGGMPPQAGGIPPSALATGKSFLTMTVWPGAKVYLKGQSEPSAV
jgi:hypothetical protein